MNPFAAASVHVRRLVGRGSAYIAVRWKTVFYLYLAAVFSVFIGLDAAVLHLTTNMRQKAFDVMVRHRLVVPQADRDIVIVDIDEASLAAMAAEYGRWPWPRQVLGEFLEHLERQRPSAVVFDILFSDPDVYNPESDAYFDAAVAATTNTYFPILRLDEASDALSRITPGMIPGATPIPGAAKPGAAVAVVLPRFSSILRGGRLGLHNIYPDSDGVAREYLVYRIDYGWAIPSLPARVVQGLGRPTPATPRILLNWRGAPFTYRTVSFSEVFVDMLSQAKQRPQDEFAGKIVLIGSTAPSLFDVKPTPMGRLHPGVEILATAIDNLKHGDYLRHPEGRFLYPLLALLIVWATAWGFYRNTGRGKIDRLFGASQFILLGVSFASINFTNTYINLTGPLTVGLVYFTIARIYRAATSRALDASVVRRSVEQCGRLHATLLLIRLAESETALGDGAREAVRRRLATLGTEPRSVEILQGRQAGLWALFEGTLAVSWVAPADDAAACARVARDVAAVTAALPDVLPRPAGTEGSGGAWYVHDGQITGGQAAREAWRALFAEAHLRWHQRTHAQGETR